MLVRLSVCHQQHLVGYMTTFSWFPFLFLCSEYMSKLEILQIFVTLNQCKSLRRVQHIFLCQCNLSENDFTLWICFQDGEKIPNCTVEVLQETSLKRATDIEKILLSVHPSLTTYHLWISHGSVTGQKYVLLLFSYF